MTSTAMRRILQTCLNQQGLEVWLLTGRPPLLRIPEGVRELRTGKPLSVADIIDLVLDGATNARSYFEQSDFYRFDWQCDWRDERFRVFLVRHGDSVMATLTPLPPGTPELEYSEDEPGRSAST